MDAPALTLPTDVEYEAITLAYWRTKSPGIDDVTVIARVARQVTHVVQIGPAITPARLPAAVSAPQADGVPRQSE